MPNLEQGIGMMMTMSKNEMEVRIQKYPIFPSVVASFHFHEIFFVFASMLIQRIQKYICMLPFVLYILDFRTLSSQRRRQSSQLTMNNGSYNMLSNQFVIKHFYKIHDEKRLRSLSFSMILMYAFAFSVAEKKMCCGIITVCYLSPINSLIALR